MRVSKGHLDAHSRVASFGHATLIETLRGAVPDMMEFFLAAAILGLAAVFVVPMVSGLLGGFVPAAYKSYLPSATSPAFSTATAINALVFGVVLAAILVLLHKVGIHAQTKGIEA